MVIASLQYATQYKFKIAWDIKRVARNSPFLTQFKNKKQQKLRITTFLLARENLKDITSRSDSIGIALISNSLHRLFNFFKQQTGWIFLACSFVGEWC